MKGPNGDVIGQYSTDAQGTILVPLTVSGTYTVTEVVPPKNHTLSRNPSQTVTVVYGKVATVTFENAPYGSLRVEKLSDTGDRLEGVTIQIKHIETGPPTLRRPRRAVQRFLPTSSPEPMRYAKSPVSTAGSLTSIL